MSTTLEAIRAHPRLRLRIVATGMHTVASRKGIQSETPWADEVISWPPRASSSRFATASATARCMDRLVASFRTNLPDIVLVVGDRVEALAAASAAHLCGIPVAHVHGGDRALGQTDDSVRHAITKLSHIHFPATPASAARILKLGEEKWRVHHAGTPGTDGARDLAARVPQGSAVEGWNAGTFALVVLHPTRPSAADEEKDALRLVAWLRAGGLRRLVLIGPNTDPGSEGVLRAWKHCGGDPEVRFMPDVPRHLFLALMRDCAVMAGNSSAGIIESGTFGTGVIDVGPRQDGREHGPNVLRVPWNRGAFLRALRRIRGRPRRPLSASENPYAGERAGRRMASILANVRLDDRLRQKLIAY
jgi:UDP-hydrolysing UDP-N-acetyl-D-glucosamine 2-epimerase